MPNRIIKESICTSPNLNELSVEAERHFYRLLTRSDDWGCFEATPAVILGFCYPLQLKKVTEAKIDKWQQELAERGLIGYWITDGRIYGQFLKFDTHNKTEVDDDGNQIRHRRKTPIAPQQLSSFQNILEHLRTSIDKYCNPNPTPNPDLNHKPSYVAEKPATPPTLPFIDPIQKRHEAIKKAWGELKLDTPEGRKEFDPGGKVDFAQQQQKILNWAKANRRSNWKRFIANWINRTLDDTSPGRMKMLVEPGQFVPYITPCNPLINR